MILCIAAGCVCGSLPVYSDAIPSISFELASPTRISLAVYRDDGSMVRELLRAESMGAGEHRFVWDGLNQEGEAAPAGDYEWRLLETDGFTARYVTSLGVNPDWQTRPPASWSQHWIGDHAGVGSVAQDETGVYLAARQTEGLDMAMKMSERGLRRLWSRPQFYQGGVVVDSAAGFGTYLLLKPDGLLYSLDPMSGAVRLSVYTTWGGEKPVSVDLDRERVLLAYPGRDAVQWRDPRTLQPSGNHTGIPGASKAVLDGQGHAYVKDRSGRLWRMSFADQSAEIFRDNSSGIVALDADGESGLLYAAVRSGEEMTVIRLDGDGNETPLLGGSERGSGPHEPSRLGSVIDLNADGEWLWIVEESPVRRVAAFDKDDARFVREWFGGHAFYVSSHVDPNDPSLFYGPSAQGWIHAWRVDYRTGNVSLEASWYAARLLDGLYPFHYGDYRPLYIDGKLFFYFSSLPALLRHDPATGQLIPAALTARAQNQPYRLDYHFPGGQGPGGYPKPWTDAVLAKGYEDVQGVSPFFSWSDENENGEMDPEEVIIEDDPGVPLYQGGGDIEPDYDLVYPSPQYSFLRLKNISTNRLPRWSWASVETPAGVIDRLADFYSPRDVYVDSSSSVYASIQAGVMIREHGQYAGGAWPYQAIIKARIAKWSPEGRLQFLVGSLSKDPSEAGAGKLFYPMHIFEGPDDTIVVNDQTMQPALIFTRDGLYAGSAFDHRADDGLPDSVYRVQGDDNQGGCMVRTQFGKTYWVSPRIGFMPVYEISGWNGLRRRSGTVTLEKPVTPPEGAGTGLTGQYYAEPQAGDPVVVRIDAGVTHNWGDSPPAPGLPANRFRVVWEGMIEAPFTDEYVLEVWKGQDDNCRILIGGEPVLESRVGSREQGTVHLVAGAKTPIRIEYADRLGDASIKLYWWSRVIDKEEIPTRYLYPASAVASPADNP